MTRTKEAITLEMKPVMRRWVRVGMLWVIATFFVVGAAALLVDVLGRSNMLITGIPYLAIAGCTTAYLLLTSPVRRRYNHLKLERESAPSETVAPSS